MCTHMAIILFINLFYFRLPDELNLNKGPLIKATESNRKAAQFQCALEACERLEEEGLLRVFSIWNNKRKTMAENDYYDSDEDVYFDRTGQIEEQRKKRKLRFEVLLYD